MKTRLFIFILIIFASMQIKAQTSSKITRDFGKPIITDSASTIIIPTVFDVSLFTSNKLALWGNYYSIIIFYNFKTDSIKKLFSNDTYIVSLDKSDYYSYNSNRKPDNSISSNWIFYRVLNFDRNKNNKIDSDDPVILYVSGIHGENLKSLTLQDENVVDFQIYEKQNMALVKVQRDLNGDGDFTSKDTDYYYIKLDLTSLTFGQKIELK
jgi:hypothetical protein